MLASAANRLNKFLTIRQKGSGRLLLLSMPGLAENDVNAAGGKKVRGRDYAANSRTMEKMPESHVAGRHDDAGRGGGARECPDRARTGGTAGIAGSGGQHRRAADGGHTGNNQRG